jgi:hypothetical protein
MTATVSTLMRHRDVSGVSGEGPVATVCEFGSGLTAVHWDSETPSVAIYTDVRHVLDLHGHKGATTLVLNDTEALLGWYERLCKFLTSEQRRPVTCGPHPDHPGRIRVVVQPEDFAFWTALLDGSTDASVWEAVNGELEHRYATPDGLVWLVSYQPLPPGFIASEAFVVPADETPLQNFEREDR